jgi:hypothetical protein
VLVTIALLQEPNSVSRKLASIVSVCAHIHAPGEVRSQVELLIGAIQEPLGSTVGSVHKSRIIETSTRMVGNEVEAVKSFDVGASLEAITLGG